MTSADRLPRKKALLIGISYSRNAPERKLNGPHNDVAAVQELLTGSYGYNRKDIVVLTDREELGHKEPNEENIRYALKELVEDAKEGDKFFFHYAGHVQQEKDDSDSEEDELDECLKPTRGGLITDDDLRVLLVDRLPVGSSLVAVVDGCHSGTSLDLPHFRCNRISRQGRDPTSGLEKVSPHNVPQHLHGRDPWSPTSIHNIDRIFDEGSEEYAVQKRSISVKTELGPHGIPELQSPIKNPAAHFCTGLCRAQSLPQREVAHVISLAACKDGQLSWESSTGESMTQILVRVLKRNTRPTLQNLIISVIHGLSKSEQSLQDDYSRYRAKKNLRPKKRDFRQDAELASLVPLDMDSIWDP